MSKGRKKYSREFKREAVGLVLEHGYSCEAAGRSLGVRGALVGRWRREIEAKAEEAFPGKGKRSGDQQRIHELEAENRRLRMEKEILKKATVFFAKESP
jgi:transposase